MIKSLTRGLRSIHMVFEERGFRGIRLWLWQHLHERFHHFRSGVDTGVDGDETNCGDYVRYQPIPFAYLDTVFQLAGIGNGKHGVLDYGCGKGRVVVAAARYPCTCVIGVDYDKRLVQIAQNNVGKRKTSFQCDDVRIVEEDASAFRVDDRVDVVIMNNPFTGDIMRNTLERIWESFQRCERPMQIYYVASHAEPCLSELSTWIKRDGDEIALGVGSGRLLRVYSIAQAVERDTSHRTSTIAC